LVSEGRTEKVVVDAEGLIGYLGPAEYFSEIADRSTKPGVAVGLAWTPHGGDILFIEASRMDGSKGLTLTGQLGDVMKESAQAALSFLRSNVRRYAIAPEFFQRSDIHIHVPAGAIPKDGPSAGVTMVAALASALTNRPIRDRFAMSGEITLRGAVLPVGGIKEKVLAARRAGIREILLPTRNKKDVDQIDQALLEGLRIHFADDMHEVLDLALKKEPLDTVAASWVQSRPASVSERR
jgi:ATP-dependent Lon protease